MRTYETFTWGPAEDPCPSIPDRLLAELVHAGLRRILPDATIHTVGVTRNRLGGYRALLIQADVPEHRAWFDEDDDPTLERISDAVARILHLPSRPPVGSCSDPDWTFRGCDTVVGGEVAA